MRVLHVLETLDRHPGLFSVALPGLLAALRDARVICSVAAGASHDAYHDVIPDGDGLVVVDEDATHEALTALAPLVDSADVVHIHTVRSEIARLAAACARGNGRPFVVSPHGDMNRWPADGRRIARWFERRRWRQYFAGVRGLLVDSDAERQAIAGRRLGLPLEVLPVGVTQSGVSNPVPDERIRLPWGAEARMMACFGDIHPHLGLANLLTAWHRQQSALKDWRLVIAGRPVDDGLQAVERELIRLGLADRVACIVYPDPVQQAMLLRDVACVIQPGLTAASPTGWQWALGGGRPVLVSGELEEADSLMDRGLWVIRPNPAGLSAGLKRVAEQSSQALVTAGKRGREWLLAERGWDRVVGRWMEVYGRASGL